jgi:hypothetical protein
MRTRLVLALGSALVATGCSASTDTSDAANGTSSAVASARLDVAAVRAVVAKLDAQRADVSNASYYADGSRVEGCWLNPAGNKLSDLQKALYCSMPLEFRLCNTVVLLSTDESDVATRYAGYLDCQAKVDAVFGGHGLFRYGSDVDDVYKSLYLERATLDPADESSVVAAAKPTYSGRSFPRVLLSIGASLTEEAADLATGSLEDLVGAFQAAGGEAR